MSKVMTVLGEIDSKDLGYTSMHDHILVDLSYWKDEFKALVPNINEDKLKVQGQNISYLRKGYFSASSDSVCLNDVDLASEEISHFKNAGGSAIVEVSPGGIRGNIEDLKKVSENAGVHIIASAGLYCEGSWPKKCVDMSISELQAHIEKEIYEGIDGTHIKAGHIKIACNNLTELEEKALRAGAQASKKSGLVLQVHTGLLSMDIQDTLRMVDIAVKEEGMDPQKLIMCHIDLKILKSLAIKEFILDHDTATQLLLEPVRQILNKGVNIGFDTFGSNWGTEIAGQRLPTDYERIRALFPLIKEGYSKQIVLGNDLFVKFSYRKYGGEGYTRVLDFVLPMLKELGVSEEDIQNMMVNNPARLLEY